MDPVTAAAIGWLADQAGSRAVHSRADIAFGADVPAALTRVVRSATTHAVRMTIPSEHQDVVLDSVLQEADDQPTAAATAAADLPEAIMERLTLRFDRLAARGMPVDRDQLVEVISDQVLHGIRTDAASSGPLLPIAHLLSLPPGVPIPVDDPGGDDEEGDEEENDIY